MSYIIYFTMCLCFQLISIVSCQSRPPILAVALQIPLLPPSPPFLQWRRNPTALSQPLLAEDVLRQSSLQTMCHRCHACRFAPGLGLTSH